MPVLCGAVVQEQGRSGDARRGHRLSCRRRSTCRPIEGHSPHNDEHERSARGADDAPFAGLAFKIATDPFVGKLTFFRVYSGVLKSGSYVYNATKDKRERVGRLLQMHANKREEIEEVRAGDIAAAIGLKDTRTGDTMTTTTSPIILEAMKFPKPVIDVAIEPKTKADQDKLAIALQKLSEEDPTFRVHSDPETAQTIISGMGELHLEIIVDRMQREFKVDANIGRPQVAYRETIKKRVEKVEGKFIRQSGGKGQYGHVVINIEPAKQGEGFVFEDKIVGGTIPREFIKPAEQGMREALEGGVIAGYPMVDVKAELVYGSYHDVDSSEMAFKIAGSMAIKEAAKRASAIILEPIMNVEVVSPDRLHGRRPRRSVIAPRKNRRNEAARRGAGDRRAGAAVGDVRLLHQAQIDDAGTRSLLDGVRHYEEVPKSKAEEIMNK